jgi:hypothetical protein
VLKADLLAVEDRNFSRLDISGTKKQFDRGLLTYPFEIDGLPEQFLEGAVLLPLWSLGISSSDDTGEISMSHVWTWRRLLGLAISASDRYARSARRERAADIHNNRS